MHSWPEAEFVFWRHFILNNTARDSRFLQERLPHTRKPTPTKTCHIQRCTPSCMRLHNSNSASSHIVDVESHAVETRKRKRQSGRREQVNELSSSSTSSNNVVPRRRLGVHTSLAPMSSTPFHISRSPSRGPATLLSLPVESITYIADFLRGTDVPECLFARYQAGQSAWAYTSNKDGYPSDADDEDDYDGQPFEGSSNWQDVRSQPVDHRPPNHFLRNHLPPNHLLPDNHLLPSRMTRSLESESGPRQSATSRRRNKGKRPVRVELLATRSIRSLAGEC
jgi:hypothetical protein